MPARSFRVLGPVEVWHDGWPVPRQTPRHRAVLAALLVDAGAIVPLDVLVDRMWNSSPPTAYLGALQAVVSKLRREPEPDTRPGSWQVLVTRDPPHQRTLAATVQWSVDLLDARQLAVFRAVSLFSGSFAADAVEAVAGPDGGSFDALRAVVAQSLVELDHGRGRYRMLETLRQYAEQVEDVTERRVLRDHHAAFTADLAERLEATLGRRDGAPGRQRLDVEQPNLRAAMAHVLPTGQGADRAAHRRVAGLVLVPPRPRPGGPAVAGRDPGRRAGRPGPRPDAGAAQRRAARVPHRRRPLHLGADERDDRDRAERGGVRPRPRAARLRGAPLGHVDKENETARDVARGMAVAEKCGIDRVRSEIAMTLGQFSRADGNPEAALEHLDRAVEPARGFGHTWAECSALWIRAKVLIELERGEEALAAAAVVHGLAGQSLTTQVR